MVVTSQGVFVAQNCQWQSLERCEAVLSYVLRVGLCSAMYCVPLGWGSTQLCTVFP